MAKLSHYEKSGPQDIKQKGTENQWLILADLSLWPLFHLPTHQELLKFIRWRTSCQTCGSYTLASLSSAGVLLWVLDFSAQIIVSTFILLFLHCISLWPNSSSRRGEVLYRIMPANKCRNETLRSFATINEIIDSGQDRGYRSIRWQVDSEPNFCTMLGYHPYSQLAEGNMLYVDMILWWPTYQFSIWAFRGDASWKYVASVVRFSCLWC